LIREENNMDRSEAFGLLRKYVEGDVVLKHSLSVESSMRQMARFYGEDIEEFGLAGLLHDIDYEKFPETHPYSGTPILREAGVPEEIVSAILGHATDGPRDTLMAKALFAVDELSSFVTACALMRPSRSYDDLEVSSVNKKLKSKGFARGVDRELIDIGAAELGLDKDVLIMEVIKGLRTREKELALLGYSTL
jgi:putative nucleotidyltransferase with HDIG domain